MFTINTFYLHDNWKVKPIHLTEKEDGVGISKSHVKDWISAEVPGTIHTDLLNEKIIDDPFFADNEKRVKWVHETDWVYQTEFDLPQNFQGETDVYLVFEGLDTLARVELNDKIIGDTANMFRTYKFPVNTILKARENVLKVYFSSPVRIGNEMLARFGKLNSVRFEERVYLRKAQYSFGWDWGPSLPTMGIWRSVYLRQQKDSWIDSIFFDTISISENSANVKIRCFCEGRFPEDYKLKIKMSHKDQIYNSELSVSKTGIIETQMEIKNPKLWWPSGAGDQPLYDLEVKLYVGNETLDQIKRKVGIRTLQLIQTENGKETFRFEINGKQIFIKGANWIPADSFLPRIKDETYHTLLTKAKEAGMNMLRIWGGGIYERPVFYDLCDELGILIWQDFMFACSSYPEDDEFLENVRAEVIENVKNLQFRPAIALWCGNNENEWIWYSENKGSYTQMPGYKIFHQEIKSIVEEHDPHRPYWPTTPFGKEDDPNSTLSGTRHNWHIWSGWVDYEQVEKDDSLFVSEFGFQAPANILTMNSVLDEKNRKVQDELFEYHNKQIEGNERLFKFLAGNLPVRTQYEDFIYLTQLNQGLALKTCLEHWRFRWPDTAGSIIWQLNDCWPVSSWSLIDSSLAPKLAYYFVKNIFASLAVLIKRSVKNIDILAINEQPDKFSGTLHSVILDPKDSIELFSISEKVSLQPGERKIVTKLPLANIGNSDQWILVSTLLDSEGIIKNRNFLHGKKWKHLRLPECRLNIHQTDCNYFQLSAEETVIFGDLCHQHANFSDRGFILLPGEKLEIKSKSINDNKFNSSEIEIFTLNSYLSR